MRRILIVIALAALAAGTVRAAVAVNGTVVTETGRKSGQIRWSGRTKTYVISQKMGATMVDVEVKASDVTELEIPEPAGLAAAAQQVDHGQGAAAIGVLTKIATDYAHLQWDKVAGGYLAQAYLSANNAAKALETCEKIVAEDPTAAYKGDLAPAYWAALIKMNRKSTLEAALNKAATSGDRFSSGAALIARGDFEYADGGENVEAAKKALVDGYLRVALLYGDADVGPRLRPEALYKAAKCFEKMGQTSRAANCRSELKQAYPTSPWASK